MAGMALNTMTIKVLSEIGFDRQKTSSEPISRPSAPIFIPMGGWCSRPCRFCSSILQAQIGVSNYTAVLARISHRLNPRLRGGAASPEAGRAEDYSGYENRGEDRKMRSEMPMDGLCLLEDDGVDTR